MSSSLPLFLLLVAILLGLLAALLALLSLLTVLLALLVLLTLHALAVLLILLALLTLRLVLSGFVRHFTIPRTVKIIGEFDVQGILLPQRKTALPAGKFPPGHKFFETRR